MKIERYTSELFDKTHGIALQNEVYRIYARTTGVPPKPITNRFPIGDDEVIYLAGTDQDSLLGHMHLEIGRHTFVHEVANVPSKEKVAVASGFTVKAELPREAKLEIQKLFWDHAWAIVKSLNLSEIFIILGTRSERFAKETGYNFTPSQYDLIWDSQALLELVTDYPGYWKEDEVRLWQVRQ